MRVPLALVTLAALALAGCAAPTTTEKPGSAATPQEIPAPWWPVGAYWDVDIQQGTAPAKRVRLANFWNDSATNHFWLGVPDRSVALDHALHDTNPLIGRIHWGILTPHEKGIHAAGMFNFPIQAGDYFGGLMFGREWQVQARAGDKPGSLVMTGVASDGSKIAYDYDPDLMWFSFIDIRAKDGTPALRVDVKAHGADAKGTFHFLRGRDYHAGPKSQGTHDETFEVKTEEIEHKSLALEIKGAVSGLLRLDLLDPSGEVKHSETLTGGQIDRVVEIPSPAKGKWTLRYVGTGTLDGTVEAVGILEYARSI